MAREAKHDNIGLVLILAAGGVIAYQWLKSKGLATVNAPGTVANSGGGSVLVGEARGIRNNNPGNIVYSPLNAWQGQTGSDGTFARFSSPQYGLRAMFKLMNTYINSNKLDTIDKIGSRWTATEQGAWKANVARFAGIAMNAKLNYSDKASMLKIANGIVVAENGSKYNGYYSATVLGSAYDAA